MLAISAGALRTLMLKYDGHADQPLLCGVPVSIDTSPQRISGNALGTVVVSLPVQVADPLELSALVPDRTTDPDVIALASEISAAQAMDIEVLRVLLVQWNENPNAAQGGAALSGIVDEATVARLQSLSQTEFDTLWLQSMLGLQQGAVGTADPEISDGANVDAIATADITTFEEKNVVTAPG